jgi:phospholipase/carboxylesterase
MVHGWLGTEQSMWTFQTIIARHALVVSMRAPFAVDGGYGWKLSDRDSSFDEGLAALHEFVSRLPGEYPVDQNRIALMGFSQGAAMSYALALSQPEMICAVAALAGYLPEPARQWVAPDRLAGKRVFIAHGTEDEVVSVAEAASAREAMLACGAQVTYGEYPIGHKLNAQGMKDLRAWLAEITG